jgi:hypothetical protein
MTNADAIEARPPMKEGRTMSKDEDLKTLTQRHDLLLAKLAAINEGVADLFQVVAWLSETKTPPARVTAAMQRSR